MVTRLVQVKRERRFRIDRTNKSRCYNNSRFEEGVSSHGEVVRWKVGSPVPFPCRRGRKNTVLDLNMVVN